MLRWIVLALSLGSAITSVIHGVFMIFGSLSMASMGGGGAEGVWIWGLPVAAAIIALIGGIVSFSGSRWGAVFLVVATVICAFSPRDIWIYGGLYLGAALLCFFVKRDDMPANYDGYEYDYEYEDEHEERIDAPRPVKRRTESFDDAFVADGEPAQRPEPRQQTRKSKTCHNCGENVPISFQFCPTCGASLHVPDGVEPEQPSHSNRALEPAPYHERERDEETERDAAAAFRNRVKAMPMTQPEDDYVEDESNSYAEPGVENGGGSMSRNLSYDEEYDEQDEQQMPPLTSTYRVLRTEQPSYDLPKRPTGPSIDPDESYQEFGRYASKSKRPKRRSLGRRLFNMLLLLVAVGGSFWFLLGLRKLPVGDIDPADRPAETQNEKPDTTTKEKPVDVLVQPVDPSKAENKAPEQKSGQLPSFKPGEPKQGIITGDTVRMRADHSTANNSKVITKLTRNTKLDILGVWRGSSQPWYNVKTSSGQEGWVRGDYVQPLGSGLPSGYSNALLASFGNDREAMTAKLGKPSKSSDSSIEWSGLSAKLSGGHATQIKLTNSKYELVNKLKVGMAQTALFNILGYPSSVSQKQLQYTEGGKNAVTVQLGGGNNIQSITVNEVK